MVAEKQKNLLTKLEELPYRRYAQMLRSKLNDLKRELDPAYFDQYPARLVPGFFSKMYEFNMTTPQRSGIGFQHLATLVTPGQYIVPRNNNILVGRGKSFYWCRTAIHCFANVTVTSIVAGNSLVPVDARAAGDIFSSVVDANGGAAVLGTLNPNATATAWTPSWSADIQMYDKQRGRFFSDAPMPVEFFTGGTYGNRGLSAPMRFEPGSEIEPRLYLKAFMPLATTSNAGFTAINAKGWVNLVVIGYHELDSLHSTEMDSFVALPDVEST